MITNAPSAAEFILRRRFARTGGRHLPHANTQGMAALDVRTGEENETIVLAGEVSALLRNDIIYREYASWKLGHRSGPYRRG